MQNFTMSSVKISYSVFSRQVFFMASLILAKYLMIHHTMYQLLVFVCINIVKANTLVYFGRPSVTKIKEQL